MVPTECTSAEAIAWLKAKATWDEEKTVWLKEKITWLKENPYKVLPMIMGLIFLVITIAESTFTEIVQSCYREYEKYAYTGFAQSWMVDLVIAITAAAFYMVLRRNRMRRLYYLTETQRLKLNEVLVAMQTDFIDILRSQRARVPRRPNIRRPAVYRIPNRH